MAVPWEDHPEPVEDWASKVLKAAGGKWKRVPDPIEGQKLVLDATCPQCDDPHAVHSEILPEQPVGYIVVLDWPKQTAAELPAERTVFCECRVDHMGRPSDIKSGCGYWGSVQVVT